jgi:signal transduction histidine kinase
MRPAPWSRTRRPGAPSPARAIQQWLGWGWLDAVHPEERAGAEPEWRRAFEDKTSLDNEIRLYHAPSGGYRWTSVRAVPLCNSDGSLRGWVGMNTDIDDRKQAEAALRESDRRKDEFLAMLGHELRNPLAAICNSVEFAGLGSPGGRAGISADEAMRQALAIVDRQGRHMTRLVNDLLDVTRITRNKLIRICVANLDLHPGRLPMVSPEANSGP